jgi:predicted dehydrogenase
LKFAIIGCGGIGFKRLRALGAEHALVVAADSVLDRARALAAERPGAAATDDWRAAARHPAVDAVVVATTNDGLAPAAQAAIEAGKHVLVEKPGGRSLDEFASLVAAAERHGVHLRVGLNHRFHPAIRKARELVERGELGSPMFVRGRYGHGGRPGYDREWRADPRRAGGGELLDQGVHLIDLARWFLGEFVQVEGYCRTYYWDMPVEDNAFLLLRTAEERVAWLHVSCTEWKNLFSLELYTERAKLHVEGLGGSYGVERLSFYRMLPQLGPPETTIWEYPAADPSWQLELQAFVDGAANGGASNAADARAALEVVERIYQRSAP